MARHLKPQTPFAKRLTEARAHMTRDAFAVILGVPKTTLGGWERGVSFPPPEILTKMAETLGVSLDWLISGREVQMTSAPAAPSAVAPQAGLDEELLDRIANEIAEVYRAENARIYPLQLVNLAGRWYADLVVACPTPEERTAGLNVMLQQLRRDLRSPQAPGGANSKRLA